MIEKKAAHITSKVKAKQARHAIFSFSGCSKVITSHDHFPCVCDLHHRNGSVASDSNSQIFNQAALEGIHHSHSGSPSSIPRCPDPCPAFVAGSPTTLYSAFDHRKSIFWLPQQIVADLSFNLSSQLAAATSTGLMFWAAATALVRCGGGETSSGHCRPAQHHGRPIIQQNLRL
jgi:hypothetical protein